MSLKERPREGQTFRDSLREMAREPRVRQMSRYVQHGDTSCLLHSLAVAVYSYRLARALRLPVRERNLARGAMLHDYFLYDWHTGKRPGPPHAFSHPYAALRNAQRDFALDHVEENIIVRHMFPLIPIPPRYRESWLVTLVDKALSVYETFKKGAYAPLRRQYLDAPGKGGLSV